MQKIFFARSLIPAGIKPSLRNLRDDAAFLFHGHGDGTEEQQHRHAGIEGPDGVLAGGEAIVVQSDTEEIDMPP